MTTESWDDDLVYNTLMPTRPRFKHTTDTHSRTLVKSVGFRIIVIISDTLLIFALTRQVRLTLGLAIATNLASTTIYYLYERLWNRISWGQR